MIDNFLSFFNKDELNPPATIDSIKKAEKDLKIKFPQEFVDVMLKSNGLEGFCGEEIISIWKIEDIVPLNKAYAVKDFFPSLIYFGTDGCGEMYAFNFAVKGIPVLKVDAISVDLKEAILCGSTFLNFLENLCTGPFVEKHFMKLELKNKIIHEIKPVRFGGSPTDPKNKVFLTPLEHAKIVTWWQGVLKDMISKKNKNNL